MPFLPKRAFSWALYDFANTIFSAIVITVYFPLYLTDMTGKNSPVGIATMVSMIAAGIVIPGLGRRSDRTGKTKAYLLVSTALCLAATALLSAGSRAAELLLLFTLANFLYQTSLVFYDSLLPVVAPPGKQGLVSGFGTGIGYAGVFFALPIAHRIDEMIGRRWVFTAAALLFLVFSLPLFFNVPERPQSRAQEITWRDSWRFFIENKRLRFFLIGNFLILDVLNAVILWFSVYFVRVFGIPQKTLIETLMTLNLAAFIYGIVLGKVTDRIGPKKTVFLAAGALTASLAIAGLSTDFAVARAGVILFGGAAAAGMWTAARKWVVQLAPPDRVGESFGLYGFAAKVSGLGSAVLSVLADSFGFRAALLSQVLLVAAGILFLLPVTDKSDQ